MQIEINEQTKSIYQLKGGKGGCAEGVRVDVLSVGGDQSEV